MTGQFEKTQIPYPGKLSFDVTYLSTNYSDREGGLSTMTIHTREGEFVSNHSQRGYMNRSDPYDSGLDAVLEAKPSEQWCWSDGCPVKGVPTVPRKKLFKMVLETLFR